MKHIIAHREEMQILITVPHGFCPHYRFRTCDTRAREIAEMLFEELRDSFPDEIQISIYYANQPRSEGDLNRPSTRNRKWRRQIQSAVERAITDDSDSVLLFDIHSFPNICESFCESSNDEIPQVVLLDERGAPHRQLVAEMREDTDLRLVSLLRASKVNDITVRARKAGAEAMLWEFNESKEALSDDDALKVVKILVEYAVRKYQSLKNT